MDAGKEPHQFVDLAYGTRGYVPVQHGQDDVPVLVLVPRWMLTQGFPIRILSRLCAYGGRLARRLLEGCGV